MTIIKKDIVIYNEGISIKTILSSGPGGQNINKVATGIQLKYNLNEYSYPRWFKERLRLVCGNLLTKSGYIIIKATNHRSQIRNKKEANDRLISFFKEASNIPKKRKRSNIPYREKQKRLNLKRKKSQKKSLRKKPDILD